MDKSAVAQRAYQFLGEFKSTLMSEIEDLNSLNDGELQDGFNAVFLEDGWVSLKGYSFGFVLHYDEPVRIDMTFGPDRPFTGYRTTFIGRVAGAGLIWVNELRPEELFTDAQQLARYALGRLASKTGAEQIYSASAVVTYGPASDDSVLWQS